MNARRPSLPESTDPAPCESESQTSLLDEVLRDQSPTTRDDTPERLVGLHVGDCIDTRHPTLRGRVRVRWSDARAVVHERWMPIVASASVRTGDRVLFQQPSNGDEPIVTAVLDGIEPDIDTSARGPSIALEPDEALRIESRAGVPLVEVRHAQSGPIVRILRRDVDLEFEGRLRLSAEQLELRARQGNVEVSANADVVVRGETIELN